MQIRIALPLATHRALAELSVDERRDARDQAVILIIEALYGRGLVTADGLDLAPRARALAEFVS